MAVGKQGFIGVGWIITVSALLQVVYNVECARYVIATGEVPIVGFACVPPGRRFWLSFSPLLIFFAYIWGGWVKGAADGATIRPRLQELTGGDLRRFYFPFMVLLLMTIGFVLHFFQPTELITISANVSNFGALIFPVHLHLPEPRTAPRPR